MPAAPALLPKPSAPTFLSAVDLVPVGDGSFKAIPRKPVELASVAQAAKLTGVPRDTIYSLYRAGFIEGTQASPRKITIFLATLYAHIEAAKDVEFWTPERRQCFDTSC